LLCCQFYRRRHRIYLRLVYRLDWLYEHQQSNHPSHRRSHRLITTDTGILTYTEKQTSAHNNDTVTIVATDVAGNKAEQLITVSVKETNLSTSVIWGGIGNDDKINANEIATVTLNGTVAIIDAVTSINISAIVFKQGNTVAHIINSNLPKINVNDSTWTLENNDTWTSKLTQGEYTVTVSLR
jgi:hypothetical protein